MAGNRWLGAVALGALAVCLVVDGRDAQASCSISGGQLHCSGLGGDNVNTESANPTAAAVQRNGAAAVTRSVGSHLGGVFGTKAGQKVGWLEQSAESGVAAGDGAMPFALWASVGAGSNSNVNAGNESFSSSRNVTMGLDYMVNDKLVVGIAALGEYGDIDTQFNVGKTHREGYGVVTYAAYNFGQGTTIDALVSGVFLDIDVMRGLGVAQGNRDGRRWMAAANVHHTLVFGNWAVRGDLGFLHSHEIQDGYYETGFFVNRNETVLNLSEGRVGARVSYGFDAVEPYVQAHYLRDFAYNRMSPVAGASARFSDDPDQVDFGMGIDWSIGDRFSIGAELTVGLDRAYEKNTSGLVNGRFRF